MNLQDYENKLHEKVRKKHAEIKKRRNDKYWGLGEVFSVGKKLKKNFFSRKFFF